MKYLVDELSAQHSTDEHWDDSSEVGSLHLQSDLMVVPSSHVQIFLEDDKNQIHFPMMLLHYINPQSNKPEKNNNNNKQVNSLQSSSRPSISVRL